MLLPKELFEAMSDEATETDLLAAEYVLGTLDGTMRRHMRARMSWDRAFARRVATWNLWLAPLSHAVPRHEPPRRLWRAIEAAIGAQRNT